MQATETHKYDRWAVYIEHKTGWTVGPLLEWQSHAAPVAVDDSDLIDRQFGFH